MKELSNSVLRQHSDLLNFQRPRGVRTQVPFFQRHLESELANAISLKEIRIPVLNLWWNLSQSWRFLQINSGRTR